MSEHRDPDAIRDDIERLIAEFLRAKADAEGRSDPILTGWALGYEYASVELEREGKAGRGVIVMEGQMVSTSYGLGAFVVSVFA